MFLNTATIREVNLSEIDSNFTARETQDYLPFLAAPSYRQPSKLSQVQDTHSLLTVTFLAILK